MKMQDCPRLPDGDKSGRLYDYSKIEWPVERPLYRPLKSETRGEIPELSIREPLYRDLRAVAKETDRHKASELAVTSLCSLSPAEVETMTARDWSEVSDFLADFLS